MKTPPNVFVLYCHTCESHDITGSSPSRQSALHSAAQHAIDWDGIDRRAGKSRGPHVVEVVEYAPKVVL